MFGSWVSEREAEADLEGIGKGHMLRIKARCTAEDVKDPLENWREKYK